MITDYTTLQTAVKDWLIKPSMDVTGLIQLAEYALDRDQRIRRQSCRGTFVITADGQGMPSDFESIDSWYYDGPTYRGPIKVVSLEQLSDIKLSLSTSGVPEYAAFADRSRRVHFAPEPAATYDTRMSYYRRVYPRLGTDDGDDGVWTTNWLLEEHPDIYLHATLVEGWLYLRDAQAALEHKTKLEAMLDEFAAQQSNEQWSGNMRPRIRAIG